MIHQSIKEVYYFCLYPASKILNPIYKLHYKLFRKRIKKTQIGCGKNYLSGFINIDANLQRKVDYVLDVRVGLPFPDNSIEFLYSCHMLEHVHINESINILREWYRILSPNGYIRLTLPDFEYIFEILTGKEDYDFPRSFNSFQGKAINFLFCDGQHKFAYSMDVIKELVLKVGFSRVELATHSDPQLPKIDSMEPGGSFSVNIFKR